MGTSFIRIGNVYINPARIISIDFDAFVWDDSGKRGVRIDMSEQSGEYGTTFMWKGEEAQAVRDMLTDYLRSRTSHEVDLPAK